MCDTTYESHHVYLSGLKSSIFHLFEKSYFKFLSLGRFDCLIVFFQ
jgi:hypothetical protein